MPRPETWEKVPRVLVLMAAHNGSAWIGQQVASILDQVGVTVDLAVSDDFSTDATRQQLEQFATDARVRILSPPAPTGSAAQNFLWLIRSQPGDSHDFVAFADQDDLWLDQKLSSGCRKLRASSAAGYSCAVTAFWNDGREITLRQSSTLTRSDFMFEGAGQGCTFILTRDFYERVRTFFSDQTELTKSIRYHDWVMYALARSWEQQWYFDPRPGLRYRQHLSNDTGARASLDGIHKRTKLIIQGWYRLQIEAIARICVAAAPSNPTVREWNSLLDLPHGVNRRLEIARFCFNGGRRRRLDRMILVAVAIFGWI